jgi:very-short-patch-repair endonuclease
MVLPAHSPQLLQARDGRRDRVLQRVGYRVLRIDAELVRVNITEAVALVVAALLAA